MSIFLISVSPCIRPHTCWQRIKASIRPANSSRMFEGKNETEFIMKFPTFDRVEPVGIEMGLLTREQ